MSYLILGLEGLIVIMVVICGSLGCLGLWRKMKAVPIEVMKDYRNPSRKPTSYYGMVDKRDGSIKFFARSIDFSFTRKIPIFDLNAWKDPKGKVKGVIGVSGRPGDDMFVPYGTALLSQAAANDYAKTVSDSVTNIMSLYEQCKKMDLRVGEQAQIEVKKGKQTEKLKGTISKINYLGVVFTYMNSPMAKTIVLSAEDVGELKPILSQEQKQVLKPLSYSDFFTEEWVMQKMGIRRVENASIMTVAQKQAIANSINNNNEFINDGRGFLEKHFAIVISLVALLFIGVMFMLGFYGANTFYSGVIGDVSALASNLGVHGTAVATSGATGSTTTISTVNIGGTALPT